MSWINKKLQDLPASATLAVKTKAGELKAQGRDIVDLSAGEPDVDTPEHIKEAAVKAMQDGKTKYTPVSGTTQCRSAIAEKLKSENSIDSEVENIIVTNGGKQALIQVFQVCIEPGDEVIIPAPYWVSYVPMVQLAGGVPIIANTDPENGYKLRPEQLEELISDKTKIFVINSPSNPTGSTYTKSELAALGKVLANKNILIVSDEVYEKITYSDFEYCSFAAAVPELKERVVTVNALSKTFSMTGWRVGYAAAAPEIIKAMSKLQGQCTSNVCSIAQEAAIAALKGPKGFLADMVANYDRRMSRAIDRIAGIDGLSISCRPEGAFYLFVRIDDLTKGSAAVVSSSLELADKLLDQGVAVVPGEAFGDKDAFRISVSLSDDTLNSGLDRIAQALNSLVK